MPWIPVASDDFNRADEATLAGNWTTVTSMGNFRLNSNEVGPQTSAQCATRWNANSFNNDQYSTVEIRNTAASYWSIGPAVRCSTSNDDYYMASTSPGPPLKTWMYKCVNGSFSQVGPTTENASWAAGDTYTLEMVGTTLQRYRNGVAEGGSGTAVEFSSGYAGMYGYWQYSAPNTVDNWVGGNVTPASGSPWYAFAQM